MEKSTEDTMGWQTRALCGKLPFEERQNFHPKGDGEDLERTKAALAICARCVVQQECLEQALQNGDGGILGGMTEKQRKQERKNRQRAGRSRDVE